MKLKTYRKQIEKLEKIKKNRKNKLIKLKYFIINQFSIQYGCTSCTTNSVMSN